jgi:hypothetical protein
MRCMVAYREEGDGACYYATMQVGGWRESGVVGDVRRLYAVATVVLRWRRELAVDASWRAFEQGFKV